MMKEKKSILMTELEREFLMSTALVDRLIRADGVDVSDYFYMFFKLMDFCQKAKLTMNLNINAGNTHKSINSRNLNKTFTYFKYKI